MSAARPVPGRPAAYTLPARETYALDNGMRVTLVPLGSIPKATVQIVVRAGELNVPAEKAWLQHLLATYLREGTGRRTGAEFAEAVAELGGDLDIESGDDTTDIGASVLSEYTPDFVRLLAEVVREPALPPSELERLKGDLRRGLDVALAQPHPPAVARFLAALYPDHAYGRPLTTYATIDGFTTGDVSGFWAREYGAQRSHLLVAGRFDIAAVRGAIAEAFSGWAAGPPPLLNPPSPRSARRVFLIDRPGAEQSTVYVGLPVIDPSHEDFIALNVTNELLGGSFHSRITLNIREDKGYTYSPHGVLTARYRDAYWVEVADIATNATGAALREVFAEIERLQSEPPSDAELEGIKNYVTGRFLITQALPGGVIDFVSYLDLHGLDETYATTLVERVYALTPEDIRRTAERYLPAGRMTISVAGDASVIRAQLAPFGEIVEG